MASCPSWVGVVSMYTTLYFSHLLGDRETFKTCFSWFHAAGNNVCVLLCTWISRIILWGVVTSRCLSMKYYWVAGVLIPCSQNHILWRIRVQNLLETRLHTELASVKIMFVGCRDDTCTCRRTFISWCNAADSVLVRTAWCPSIPALFGDNGLWRWSHEEDGLTFWNSRTRSVDMNAFPTFI